MQSTSNTGDALQLHQMLADWTAAVTFRDTNTTWGNGLGGFQADGAEVRTTPRSACECVLTPLLQASATAVLVDVSSNGHTSADLRAEVAAWVTGAAVNRGLLLTINASSGSGVSIASSNANVNPTDERPLLSVSFVGECEALDAARLSHVQMPRHPLW